MKENPIQKAAILNGIHAQKINALQVSDAMPCSLGVAEKDDKMCIIIRAQTKIPCSNSKLFKTVSDMQSELNVIVYEGEDYVASRNTKLCGFTISNIPPDSAGTQTVLVTLTINDEGMLSFLGKGLTEKT
ncbi:unnamed protein product [Oppiella nova]|uniref:Uncharacterized protein n=1 Tax=Oppiella nova TaxID=334625 RepID=A0A7R9LAI8_9ACAR|nr:unnamed protein product [Oppiella nova]CAG2159429.1 unnamed protein product [Oppiella nova]